MNLLLQDPFLVLKDYPSKLTNTLENPLRTECVEFSPLGDYLAVGSQTGAILIYDMDTMRPFMMLGDIRGSHTRAVSSLAWSFCGRYLLSSGRDWYVKLWDLKSASTPMKEAKFDSPVWSCRWRDSTTLSALAAIFDEPNAYMIDFSTTLDSPTDNSQVFPVRDSEVQDSDDGNVLVCCVHPQHRDLVITGSSKGTLSIYKMNQKYFQRITMMKISAANIKHLLVSPNGDKLVINSSDRTIRQYNMQVDISTNTVSLEIEYKYQDVINKLQWNSILLSQNTAEYLVASTHGSSAHELYIWETSSGTLVTVLEGAEEELMDIKWNFYNMFIASNGLDTGAVHIWSIVIPPKWSALAPDFIEVDENVDYEEKENEFDEEDLEQQNLELTEAEEVKIDLITKEPFDVRGNDMLRKRFVIPYDYERMMLMQYEVYEDETKPKC